MPLALIVTIFGALFFIIGTYATEPVVKALGELGKWAFIVGLAAFFFVK